MQLGRQVLLVVLLSLQSHFLRAQLVNIVQTATNRNFTTLVTAVTAASLVNTLSGSGPLTVFAPTDTAFSQLSANVVNDLIKPENNQTLNKILLYHVVLGNYTTASINTTGNSSTLTTVQGGTLMITRNGSAVQVNSANVVTADVLATNGVIHAIDRVLLPGLDLVETALLNGNFRTLIAALRAADLIGTLKATGPFTVFAPNDAAFGRLPNGTLADLLKPENKDKLSNILKYHVINGRSTAAQVNAMTLPATLTTLSGSTVIISRNGTTLKVNNATIIATDVMGSNGLIHVIDTVLMPPSTSTSGVSTLFTRGSLSVLIGLVLCLLL